MDYTSLVKRSESILIIKFSTSVHSPSSDPHLPSGGSISSHPLCEDKKQSSTNQYRLKILKYIKWTYFILINCILIDRHFLNLLLTLITILPILNLLLTFFLFNQVISVLSLFLVVWRGCFFRLTCSDYISFFFFIFKSIYCNL